LLKRILTALVLVPVTLLLVLRAPVWLLAVITGAVALVTAHEFLKLAEAYGVRPFWKATYVFVGLLFVVVAVESSAVNALVSTGLYIYSLGAAAMLAAFFFLCLGMVRAELREGYPAAAASVFGFAYVALPLACLVQVREQAGGVILVVYLFLVVWAGDVFAYFVGRSVGRHLMAPRVSPKKTWEGAASSLVASVAIGTWFYAHATAVSAVLLRAGLIQQRDGVWGLQRPELASIVALSVVLNVAAQLGDLVESLIKRGAGVKDSGAILPGHGGMLDRIDALLFAAPVLWCWAAWRVLQ
jgi:phosphatidate cytidylyltransferase